MREPEVITGPRAGYAERAQQAAESAQRRPGPGTKFLVNGAVPAGKKVYKFVASRYRLQLTAPYDEKLPDGRVRAADKAKVVQAEDYFAILDTVKDKDRIDLIEGIPEEGVEPFRWMTPPHRSLNVDFWDYAIELEAKKKQSIEAAADTLLNNTDALLNPEVRKRVIEALRATGNVEGFGLPEKKANTKPVKSEEKQPEA